MWRLITVAGMNCLGAPRKRPGTPHSKSVYHGRLLPMKQGKRMGLITRMARHRNERLIRSADEVSELQERSRDVDGRR